MIEFQRVSKRYPNGFLALDNVNLEMKQGDMAFLTGHSGAGKSTLLKMIAAMESPSSGRVVVSGQQVSHMPARRIPYLRRQIGVILQTPNLLMDRTVFDNVALPLVIGGYSYKEMAGRVRAMLSKVCLPNKERSYPYELSGGEQQRVAIARAIINKPALLIADEPTGNLDPALSSEIMHLFEQFNSLGMTILIATHDLSLISRLNHRTLALAEGKLVHE